MFSITSDTDHSIVFGQIYNIDTFDFSNMDFDDFEVHAERHYRKLEEIIGISFSGDPYRMNQSRITTEVIEIALGPNGEYGVCYSFVSTDGVSVYSILGVVSQDENTNPKAFDTMRRIMNSFVITPSGAN